MSKMISKHKVWYLTPHQSNRGLMMGRFIKPSKLEAFCGEITNEVARPLTRSGHSFPNFQLLEREALPKVQWVIF
jgi:hypothetical protein